MESNKKAVALLDLYLQWLQKRPVATKSATSCVLTGIAAFLAQQISAAPLNYRRLLAFSSFGLVCTGPLTHHWFKLLDRHGPKSLVRLLASCAGGPPRLRAWLWQLLRVVVDRSVFYIPFQYLFFLWIGVVEGKQVAQIVKVAVTAAARFESLCRICAPVSGR